MNADTPGTVGQMGERALVARLQERVGPPPDHVVVGIGDDAAAIEPGRSELTILTTDNLIEGVHFRREWSSPSDIGHKALAVNLSDIAAMGAMPRASLLSLALPPDLPVVDFDALIEGYLALAASSGATLTGGNITRSPGPLVLDVTLLGQAHRRKMLRRGGGRAGDELYVTGQLGGAAAALELFQRGGDPGTEAERDAAERCRRPTPRWRCGLAIARGRAAAACMDLSDGLADAARQLAEAAGTGAVIEGAALPIHPAAAASDDGGLRAALTGGEDYELLFAVRPRFRRRFLGAMARQRDLPVTLVGRLTSESEMLLSGESGVVSLPQGFEHFTS